MYFIGVILKPSFWPPNYAHLSIAQLKETFFTPLFRFFFRVYYHWTVLVQQVLRNIFGGCGNQTQYLSVASWPLLTTGTPPRPFASSIVKSLIEPTVIGKTYSVTDCSAFASFKNQTYTDRHKSYKDKINFSQTNPLFADPAANKTEEDSSLTGTHK